MIIVLLSGFFLLFYQIPFFLASNRIVSSKISHDRKEYSQIFTKRTLVLFFYPCYNEIGGVPMDCIFCKIANKEIPAYIVYEDEIVTCFLDTSPDSNGHTLIVPKEHTLDLTTIDENTWNHIFQVAKKVKKKLEDTLHCDGLTLIQNNGDVQEVKHFHLHLKPYYNTKQEIKPIEEIYKIITQK